MAFCNMTAWNRPQVAAMICVGFLRAGPGFPILMMHEVIFYIVNVTKSSKFGLSKTDHRKNQRLWLWERTTSSTWVCADGTVGSRYGGYLHLFAGC